MTTVKKKLIETSLPLEAINAASAREKSIRHGHPSTLHLYWARRPLATVRAVLFAQLVDDPASRPDEFPTVESQDKERARLHALMEKLIIWENSNDEKLLEQAREEIRKSNDGKLPAVVDPFAGGGSIPLEAQRLGLESHASDLNPLAVLINKALIEIPPKFAGWSPVFPGAAEEQSSWLRAEGLAADVQHYGQWLRDEAEKRIGHLYPKVTVPGGTEHTVIAWIWARTVISPNPAHPIETPLVRSWWLSKRKGKEAWVKATVVDGQVRYEVQHNADGPKGDADGTVNRRGAVSIADGTPIDLSYIRAESRAGRMGAHLIAVVADGGKGRLYISPNNKHIDIANVPRPDDVPTGEVFDWPGRINVYRYGMTEWANLFTNRQLVALTTLSDLVSEARSKVLEDVLAAGIPAGERLEDGGADAEAYADAVATYLGLAVSKAANVGSSLASWMSDRGAFRETFARQAMPMVWDYAEINPLGGFGGTFSAGLDKGCEVIKNLPMGDGVVTAGDAKLRSYKNMIISTDPPYYDNIGYSDLSDFFYVWLRKALRTIHPSVLGTMLTPKVDELVANPYRHDGKQGAEKFFIEGFNSVFHRIRENDANPDVPMTVYYAYKQQDSGKDGTSSTGWHTLLDGLIRSGWEITATWPMRTEGKGRLLAKGTNALASSILLACRPRPAEARAVARRAFVAALKSELPEALRTLMQGAIAPVDLAQAAIGPGISVFSRYAKVREADGSDMSVRDALQLINATLDEVLGEQESDLDSDTRFAVRWYRQYGWAADSSGIADQLARSSDTSLAELQRGGIFEAKGGKARLLSPTQLNEAWDPAADEHVSVWEATVRLAAVLAKDGVDKVAELLPAVGEKVSLDAVKELGFLLFHEAEKNKDTDDAILFNGLVSSWGDLNEQARQIVAHPKAHQEALTFEED